MNARTSVHTEMCKPANVIVYRYCTSVNLHRRKPTTGRCTSVPRRPYWKNVVNCKPHRIFSGRNTSSLGGLGKWIRSALGRLVFWESMRPTTHSSDPDLDPACLLAGSPAQHPTSFHNNIPNESYSWFSRASIKFRNTKYNGCSSSLHVSTLLIW